MKADLLKRLFTAIYSNDELSIKKITELIVMEEEKKGHSKLSKQLKDIIERESFKKQNNKKWNASKERGFSELPKSSRNNEELVNYKNLDKLKHHMVLPQNISERFIRIEKEYAARERLLKYNLKPKKKILLYGPPGCGKTLGAERLAYNTGLTLMKVKFDSIISSYLGESSSNLRKVFDASQRGKYLLLLDECDFIAKARNYGNDVGEIPRIVNMLLLLLDEYEAPGILVATTNLESSLDKALFRRFDDVIEVPKPGKLEIEKLMRMTLSAVKVSKDINWPKLVEQMDDFSASNVVSVANNALKYSILEGNEIIKEKYIEEAIAEIKVVY